MMNEYEFYPCSNTFFIVKCNPVTLFDGIVHCATDHAISEVFAQPIQNRATAVIAAHNHPGGNLTPSSEDLSVTDRLTEAELMLGIELDHIIFSEQGYYSFLEQGKMHN